MNTMVYNWYSLKADGVERVLVAETRGGGEGGGGGGGKALLSSCCNSRGDGHLQESKYPPPAQITPSPAPPKRRNPGKAWYQILYLFILLTSFFYHTVCLCFNIPIHN